MSGVRTDDVRRVAELARLALSEERLASLAAELGGILAHMQVLRAVDLAAVATGDAGADGAPLRPDAGPPLPLARARESFAPLVRDGFFLVPRLASHDDGGVEA
jgi:aspartyl-tRNA(Asn)/glutamyl-tRNA(Gln) amidotransferase subunit C